jgi:hypothetical protein
MANQRIILAIACAPSGNISLSISRDQKVLEFKIYSFELKQKHIQNSKLDDSYFMFPMLNQTSKTSQASARLHYWFETLFKVLL